MSHKWLLFLSWLIRFVLIWLPDAALISRFRGFLYGFFIPECGKNFQVSSSVRLINLENIHVGNDVYLAPGVVINAIDKVVLNSGVMVGFNSVIVSGNHSKHNGSYRFGRSVFKPIFIGPGTWISANCTITAGAVIGKCVLVGANSVVKGELPNDSVCFGIPAKPYP